MYAFTLLSLFVFYILLHVSIALVTEPSTTENSVTPKCIGKLYVNGTISKCFWLLRSTYTQASANIECMRNGGNLATIDSPSQAAFVRGSQSADLQEHAWIGVVPHNGVWKNWYGRELAWFPWNPGEPQYPFGDPNYACVVLDVTSSKWMSVACGNVGGRGALCESSDTECSYGHLYQESTCFWTTQLSAYMYGETAQLACSTENGSLATINNAHQSDFINDTLYPSHADQEILLGIMFTNGVWKNTNGARLTWFAWGPEQPRRESSDKNDACVTFDLQTADAKSEGCSELYPALCEVIDAKIEPSRCSNVPEDNTQITGGNNATAPSEITHAASPCFNTTVYDTHIIEKTVTAYITTLNNPATVFVSTLCHSITVQDTHLLKDTVTVYTKVFDGATVIRATPTCHSVTAQDTHLLKETVTVYTTVFDSAAALLATPTCHSVTVHDTHLLESTVTAHTTVFDGATTILATLPCHSVTVQDTRLLEKTVTAYSTVRESVTIKATECSDQPESPETTQPSSDCSVIYQTVTIETPTSVHPCANDSATPSELPTEELKQKIQEVRKELEVDKKELGSTKRKLNSAPDSRVSSSSIGACSFVLICLCFLVPAICDMPKYFKDLRHGVGHEWRDSVPNVEKSNDPKGERKSAKEKATRIKAMKASSIMQNV